LKNPSVVFSAILNKVRANSWGAENVFYSDIKESKELWVVVIITGITFLINLQFLFFGDLKVIVNAFVSLLSFLLTIGMLFKTSTKIIWDSDKQIILSIVLIFELIMHIVVLYAIFFCTISALLNGSFSEGNKTVVLGSIDALYYSITTFTTTGYGDIIPMSNVARMIASSEMIFGFLTSTFVMSILVSSFLRLKKVQ
jgi:voltage-gated potassium channel